MNSYKAQARKSLLEHKKQFLASLLYIILYNLVSLLSVTLVFQHQFFNIIKGFLVNGINSLLLFFLVEYYFSIENRSNTEKKQYSGSKKISDYFYGFIVSCIYTLPIIVANFSLQGIHGMVDILPEPMMYIIFLIPVVVLLFRYISEYLIIFYIMGYKQQNHVFHSLKNCWCLMMASKKEVVSFELCFFYYWLLDILFFLIGGVFTFASKNAYFSFLFLYPSFFGMGIVLVPYYIVSKIEFCKALQQKNSERAVTK